MPQKTAKKSARSARVTVSTRPVPERGSSRASRARASAAPTGRSTRKVRASVRKPSGALGTSEPPPQRPGAVERNGLLVAEPCGPAAAQLVVRRCAEAVAFYERAFGAQRVLRTAALRGLQQVQLEVCGVSVVLCEQGRAEQGGAEQGRAEQGELPSAVPAAPRRARGTTPRVTLHVQDVDALFQRAVQAGATATMPPQDQFWGERFAQVEDPYGQVWSLARRLREVTPDELRAALARMHAAEA